jgi:dipeptide/tripeptide permease
MRVNPVGHSNSVNVTVAENLFVDVESLTPPSRPSLSYLTSSTLREQLKILQDPEVFREYKLSKKNHFDFISIIPSLLVSATFFAARFNWSHIVDGDPFFLVAHVLIIIFNVIFWPCFSSLCIIFFTSKDRRNQLPYIRSAYIVHSTFWGRIEDLLLILASLSFGFILLARVLKGQCDSNVTEWESQR